jgi:hypothetical protein
MLPPPLVGSSTFILLVVFVVVLAVLAAPPSGLAGLWCVLLLLLPFLWLLIPLRVEDAHPAAPAVAVLIEAGGAAMGAPSTAPAAVLLVSTMKDGPDGVAGVVLVLVLVLMVLSLLFPGPLRLLGIPIIVWWPGGVWPCAGKNLSPGLPCPTVVKGRRPGWLARCCELRDFVASYSAFPCSRSASKSN